MFAISTVRAPQRRGLLAGVAALAAAAGLSAAAQDAQAAFTLKECEGASGVVGQGASFQTAAQAFWRTQFNGTNGCGGTPTAPSYKGNGSGNGLASFGNGGGTATGANALNCTSATPACAPPLANGVRDKTTSFGGTDEPPDSTQTKRMNDGDTTTTADDGLLHLIPAATGSSTVIVNLPDGCNVSGAGFPAALKTNGATGAANAANTTDTETDGTSRLRIPNSVLEKVFAGDSDANEWGELITAAGLSGSFTGAPTSTQHTGITDCALVPIKRIVRFDVSGTTYGFKAFLSLVNNGRQWLSTYTTPDNTFWPAGNGSSTPVKATPITPATAGNPATFCPDSDTNKLCSSNSANATNLSILVGNTDGAIGYADLATARNNGFEHTASTSQTAQTDDRYWVPLQNKPGGTTDGYVEPTSDPAAHRIVVSGGQNVSTGSKGANCSTAPISGAPTPANSPKGDPTLGNWGTTAAAGGSAYPACVLTYILAWDDNAPIYGTVGEEGKARTVKDFLTKTVVSGFGQSFTGQDYSALPALLLGYAQTGVNAIDWNKSATSGGGTTTTTTTTTTAPPTTTAATTPPTTTVPPVVIKPSNAFSVATGKVNSGRTSVSFAVTLPGKGQLQAAATYKSGSKTVKLATINSNVTAAGTAKLTVKLSSAARKVLKKKKKLSVKVAFTFTPTGGDAKSLSKSVTVRAKAAKKKRK